MSLSISRSILVASLLVLSSIGCGAQTQPDCPTASGVYGLSNNGNWIELHPARARTQKVHGNYNPFDPKGSLVAVYPGTSEMQLPNAATLCATGTPLGSIFDLAHAKVHGNDREVTVSKSTVRKTTNDIDQKQAVHLDETRDSNGAYILRAGNLEAGQYILFLRLGDAKDSELPAFEFAVQ